ncbi:uncharacterized protein LOC111236724 [Seriola dumerili]|uniref:uncharacterized protein LOC111236724 n=1 Tax=Seriola dumerili TaxID=41447 RepID=UPI000BBF09D8|nr:uncharacterized protein LOC111236724 [Seriola dumerili]
MRSKYCLTILHVSMLALLGGTLEADSDDCETVIKVQRNTLYEAFVGQEFTMNCTVSFCNSSPPSVSWHKVDQPIDPVNVSSGSHIKTEWKELSHSEGTSYLIFQKILVSDSGLYQCRGGDGVSHNINVSVHGVITDETSTVLWTTLEQGGVTAKKTFWPCVYRVVGVMVFAVIVIAVCLTTNQGCKGVCRAGESTNAPDPSCQPSHVASPTIHIYENNCSTP